MTFVALAGIAACSSPTEGGGSTEASGGSGGGHASGGSPGSGGSSTSSGGVSGSGGASSGSGGADSTGSGGTGGTDQGSGGSGGSGAGDGGSTGQGGADASPPDDGSSGGGDAPVTASGPVLLITGTDPVPAPDTGMMAELTALGLKVDFVNSDKTPVSVATAMGHSLIIVSPNTPRSNIPATYKDLAIPMIVSKDGPAQQLMMAAAPYTTDPNQKSINIVAPMDPLAASFPAGPVAVMGAGNRMVNGMPSADAKVVATLVGSTRPAIFYYTTGQMMLGGTKAPAKRIGFFWHRTEDATPNGRKLFSAAVQWALKP